jgi:hypothetical protein
MTFWLGLVFMAVEDSLAGHLPSSVVRPSPWAAPTYAVVGRARLVPGEGGESQARLR